jgi:uncharacterized phosphatase
VAFVYLIRHARSTGNQEDRLIGASGSHPLTATGRRQALGLRARLRQERIDVMRSSPLPRAVQTAEILCADPAIPDYQIENALTERHFGDFEGMARPELLRARARLGLDAQDPTGYFPDGAGGAEPHRQVAARVEDVVRSLVAGHERVALLTHAGAIKCFLYQALGLPESTPRAIKIFQAGYAKLKVAPAGHLTLHELWRNPLQPSDGGH